MAGSYPDVPSRRMACDADGCVGLWRTNLGIPWTEDSAAQIAEWTDEDNVTYQTLFNNQAREHAVIFPELREVDGVFWGTDRAAGASMGCSTSGDSTNGIDGTFTQRIAPGTSNHGFQTYDTYRDDINSLAVSNVRVFRMDMADGNDNAWQSQHIYGEISAGETPDRLLWFDQPSALEFQLPIDWGDVPRGSAEDRVTFLKNNSSSLTASTVQVTAEDLYLGSGSWYTFDDGTGFTSTKALASSIANGANSPNITIRRDIPDSEDVGLHAARAFVSVGSWA